MMGYSYLYTGTGAGKTMNALGLALRSVGHKRKVVIIQFLKWWKNKGEYKIQNMLTPYYEIYQFGRRGWIGPGNLGEKDRKLAEKALKFAEKIAKQEKPDLLVLDEVNLALHCKLLEAQQVLELLDKIPEKTDVVFTGRYAPKELIDKVDFVNEVVDVKYPSEKVTTKAYNISLRDDSLNEDEAICNPSDFVRYVAQNKKISADLIRVPHRLVITYQRSTYERASKLIDGKCADWWMYGDAQPFCVGRFNNVEIGLIRLWIGAPAAVMTLEEMIACGSKIIFEVGLSGGLQLDMQPSDVVVVTGAIRDEGTSNHYLPRETRVESSQRLRKSLVDRLNKEKIKYSVGPVWSTDAVYRETCGKFRKFKDLDVLAVNMETSAIFALAKYRNVEAASVQVISDILTENGWLQAYEHQSVLESTEAVLKAVLNVLSEAE